MRCKKLNTLSKKEIRGHHDGKQRIFFQNVFFLIRILYSSCTLNPSFADTRESEKLGFLGTCPSNLGTGLRASVMIKLTKFNETEEARVVLEEVCSKFDLQPRGSAGEHSAAVDDKFDVSNKQRLGFTEVRKNRRVTIIKGSFYGGGSSCVTNYYNYPSRAYFSCM